MFRGRVGMNGERVGVRQGSAAASSGRPRPLGRSCATKRSGTARISASPTPLRFGTACRAKGNGNGSAKGGPRSEDAAWLARKGALDAVMKDIEKQYGKGIVTVLGDDAARARVGMIPTGVHTLDLALGGGIPEGRIVEVYGPESSGKTTLAMHAIAEVQKRGGTAVLVDAEHAFDPVYSQKVGVDSKSAQPLPPSCTLPWPASASFSFR